MTVARRGMVPVLLLVVLAAWPRVAQSQDDAGYYEAAPKRWSAAWYAEEASTPIGSRQWFRFGKSWPPWPRPTGKRPQFTAVFHAAHYWPHPYSCQDQHYVRSIIDQQVSNGWVTATTLYDYHFDREKHELTQAGLLRLRWILDNAPANHRQIYVQHARVAVAQQIRMASVQTAAAEFTGQGNLPPIVSRITTPLGRPAAEIVDIQQALENSVPIPRISPPSNTGTSGK